jgi:hypothetical protein
MILSRPLTFMEWYQLGLHETRILIRKAMSTAWGMAIANSTEDIPLAFFEAICDTMEEAKEMAAEANSLRKLARMEAERDE